MAQSFTHYRVFLASPSDVAEERNLIEAAINELNNTVCKSLNIKLDLVKWETDSYPSVGAYSQDVINTQINDYDFFSGFRKRFENENFFHVQGDAGRREPARAGL